MPEQTLLNNCISWSSQCSLRGVYDGTLNLTNEDRQYTATLLWTTIKIVLEATQVSEGIADPSCFAGAPTWIYGIVHAFDDARLISENTAQVKVKSFFQPLAKKPINSELFDTDVKTVLDSLVGEYIGTPAALYDFTALTGANTLFGAISGNNILDELRKVALVGEADLFVKNDGILTAQYWKDNNSALDVTIPDEAIKSARIPRNTSVGASRYTVRGRFISQFDCGEQYLTVEELLDPFTPKTFNPPSKHGKLKHCGNEGIGKPKTVVKVNKLKGGKANIRGATVTVTGDGDFDYVEMVDDDRLEVALKGLTFLDQGTKDYEIEVKGRIRSKNDFESPNAQLGRIQDAQVKTNAVLGGMVAGLSGNPVDLGNPIGDLAQKVADKDKSADEPEPIRVEMVVNDSDLQGEFGVITEQIDVLYANDKETLFDIAIRKFQEYKMSRKTWKVETSYLPCLELNQVVRFTTPDTATTITGLLSHIAVNYSGAGPEASMTLTIQSFEDIGSTSYTSENLFMYPELCGIDDSGWKEGGVIPSGSALRLLNGYCAFDGSGGEVQLDQTLHLESGASYNIKHNLVKDSGGDMIVEVLDSGVHSSTTYSAGGNDLSITFTPNEKVNKIRWRTTGLWYCARPRLFKTVTK